MLEAWKPNEDMKFRLEFVFMCHSTYKLFQEFNRIIFNCQVLRANFFLKARGYKIEFYNFLSFTFLEILTLESWYFIGQNSFMYDIKKCIYI